MDEKSQDEWVAEYGSVRPQYVEYARRLEALTKDLLQEESIDVIQVESRAKTVASFSDKIRRKERDDKQPFSSVMDLVGVRIITYYLDDVARVGQLLEREFNIDPNNSMDKAQDLASDQFGYRSAHYVARLTPSRSELIEWRSYAGFSAEFQVRTSLQHAWAAVSHKIDYKSAQEAPASMRRKLFQLSALFELADEQFAAIRDQRTETENAYGADVTAGRLDEVPVDTSSLAAYWLLSKTGIAFRSQLVSLGFQTEDFSDCDNDRLKRDRKDLVKVLRKCGLLTLANLDEYISGDRILIIANEFADYNKEVGDTDDGGFDGSVDDLLTMFLLVDYDIIDDEESRIYIEPTMSELKAIRDRLAQRNVPLRTA